MTKIFNQRDETAKHRQLRTPMPSAKRALWKHLCGEALGCKFRRQTSVGVYVVDFYCARLKLVIEVDGVCTSAPWLLNTTRNGKAKSKRWAWSSCASATGKFIENWRA